MTKKGSLNWLLIAICCLLMTNFGYAQNDHLWADVTEAAIQIKGERQIVPQAYRTVQVNETALADKLAAAPLEFTPAAQTASIKFNIPMPDGEMASFRIVESPIMEAELAAKFPKIKTYAGQGVTDPAATIRLDITPHGFHAMILANGYSVFY